MKPRVRIAWLGWGLGCAGLPACATLPTFSGPVVAPPTGGPSPVVASAVGRSGPVTQAGYLAPPVPEVASVGAARQVGGINTVSYRDTAEPPLASTTPGRYAPPPTLPTAPTFDPPALYAPPDGDAPPPPAPVPVVPSGPIVLPKIYNGDGVLAPLIPPGAQVLDLQPAAAVITPASAPLRAKPADAGPVLNPLPPAVTSQAKAIDPVGADVAKTLAPLAAKMADGQVSEPADVAHWLDEVQQSLEPARLRAALSIRQACLCKPMLQPVKLGACQPLPAGHACKPGEAVELYLELHHLTPAGREPARLRTVLELRDRTGAIAHRLDFDKTVSAPAPGADAVQVCQFTVPALTAGNYMLTVRVDDAGSKRSATRELPITVAPMTEGSPR